MSPERDDPTPDGEGGTQTSQSDCAPGRLTPEDALSLTCALAAEADFIHAPQYWRADPQRINDGLVAVGRLIDIHLTQARREGRAGRARRRVYGQNVTGVVRQTNEVNLRLAQSWLAVSLEFLPRTPKHRRPAD